MVRAGSRCEYEGGAASTRLKRAGRFVGMSVTSASRHRRRLTVTVNDAKAVLPLASFVQQRTSVLPSGKRFPDDGAHKTWRSLPSSSVAVTAKVTRALFAPFAACTVWATAPLSLGAVRWTPGTVSVPVHVSW